MDWANDISQVEPATQADERALGKTVLLEELHDDLEIPAARQIDRILVPALERLLLGDVGGVVDMLVEIDMVLNVVLLRVHVLPPLQHELALHQSAAERDQL